MNMTMNAYESVGLVPLSLYLIRSDFLGGMCPDQTYNFAASMYVCFQADPQTFFKLTPH